MKVVKKGVFHKTFRPLLNLVGSIKGYSGCLICGDTWDWKKAHTIDYRAGHGAFPTCEECWQTCTDEEIIEAAILLSCKWREQGSIHGTELVKATTEAVEE